MTTSELGGGGWIGHWSPGIGDPTAMGWLTVALYVVGAWLCCKVALRQAGGEPNREALLWWLLGFGLVALGINKQLDLQTALTEFGRILAMRQGWYERRHGIQLEIIYAAVALALIAGIAVASLARKAHPAALVASVGGAFLMAFIIVRAASFHHVDILLKDEYFGLRVNWLLEIGGILTIIAAACWRLRAARAAAS